MSESREDNIVDVRAGLDAARREYEWTRVRMDLLEASETASAASMTEAQERVAAARSAMERLEQRLRLFEDGQLTQVYRIRYPLTTGAVARLLRRLDLREGGPGSQPVRRERRPRRPLVAPAQQEQRPISHAERGRSDAKAERAPTRAERARMKWLDEHPDPWLDCIPDERHRVAVRAGIAERLGDPLALDRLLGVFDAWPDAAFGTGERDDCSYPLGVWLHHARKIRRLE